MDDVQMLRYARHILLPQLGYTGQAAICQGRALVLGVGGLGCAAAAYLVSSGVRQLILVDDDRVEISNLQRQILHIEASLGQFKVVSARNALLERSAACDIVAVPRRADTSLLDEVLPQVTVALDCSDNFATRQLLNAACVTHRVPLVSGAALQMSAQVAAYDVCQSNSPCYACVFPPDHQPVEARCADMGVFAPLVGLTGSLQAALALQLLAARGGEMARSQNTSDTDAAQCPQAPPIGQLWQIDLQTWSFDAMHLRRDPHCKVCSSRVH